MSSTIPQNAELLKNFFDLLSEYRPLFKQKRTFLRVMSLVLGEIFVFARHTISQIIMALGRKEEDWTAWYRVFSHERFPYEAFRKLLLRQVLSGYKSGDLLVVAGDSSQTPRSSRKMEGSGWLRNLRTPPFMLGIHAAQRWFHGAVLLPEAQSYSRALPLYWEAAFTPKSKPKAQPTCTEGAAALEFLNWLKAQLTELGRKQQRLLMVADGSL
jgi:DDE superfamily endonuclease